jgi:hypothetical protein
MAMDKPSLCHEVGWESAFALLISNKPALNQTLRQNIDAYWVNN